MTASSPDRAPSGDRGRSRVLARSAATAAGLAGVSWAVTHLGQPRPATYPLHGRVAVVTGGNSGIGKETAVALARGGATVAITARDVGRGRDAVAEIRRRAGHEDVHLVLLDLAGLASVRAAADEVAARFPRVDVLVNNAGAIIGERRHTVDGFEVTIGANHLGPFLLTNLLLPRLRASAPARVVTISSVSHRQGRLDLDDLMWEWRPYRPLDVYATSKLANVLFARELARRAAGTGVTSNAVHPGTVRSGFGHDGDAGLLLRAGLAVAGPVFVGAERAASTPVYAAADPALESVTGQYLSRRRVSPPSRAARDDDLAAALWERSAELVGA